MNNVWIEDENEVRPSWMPWKDDYRQLDIEQLSDEYDCNDAMSWLNDRLADWHSALELAEQHGDAAKARSIRWHLSRIHNRKNDVYRLRGEYLLERKEEFKREMASMDPAKLEAWKAAQKEIAKEKAARHRAGMDKQAEIAERAAARKAARIKASEERDAQRKPVFYRHLRSILIEEIGLDRFNEIATEAGERVNAEFGEEVKP